MCTEISFFSRGARTFRYSFFMSCLITPSEILSPKCWGIPYIKFSGAHLELSPVLFLTAINAKGELLRQFTQLKYKYLTPLLIAVFTLSLHFLNIFQGVKVIGYTDIPSRLASQSSGLFSNNLCKLIKAMSPDKEVFDYEFIDDFKFGNVDHVVSSLFI